VKEPRPSTKFLTVPLYDPLPPQPRPVAAPQKRATPKVSQSPSGSLFIETIPRYESLSFEKGVGVYQDL
jgi:hypothetical protein